MRVKLRRSAGSAKCVFIVEGKSSSVRSFGSLLVTSVGHAIKQAPRTFLNSNLSGTGLRLFLRRGVLVLLHTPDLLFAFNIKLEAV